jgi:hypothetical protein
MLALVGEKIAITLNGTIVGVDSVPARQLIGYTAPQLIVNLPLVLLILWLSARTLPYSPPHFQ